MKMYDDYGLYLDGKFVKGAAGTFDVINPFDESVLGQAPLASSGQVKEAIEAAKKGQAAWAKLNPWERGETLQKVATALKDNFDDIAKTVTLETGKPLAQSERELNLAIDQFIWFGEQTKRIEGRVINHRNPNTTSYVTYEPIGTVAAFSSWNFPILLMARKLAPALAAGCPVIVRGTNVAPLVGMKLFECCHLAGFPEGLVSFICGSASEVSSVLMSDVSVRKVSLTGSTSVGQSLIKQSAETLKKVTMELGGHAPVVVHDDVDVAAVATLSCGAKFANSGQVCVSATRFYVHESIIDQFCDVFVQEAKKIKLGNGLDKSTTMGPLVHERRRSDIEAFMKHVQETGGNILLGGKRAESFDKGYFFEPTVIRDLPSTSNLLCDEIFGPIALIQPFKTLEEAIEKANSTEYGLASYVFSNSLEKSTKTASQISAGMVGVNTFAIATAEVPFGGIKGSGFGRESGAEGMHEYLNTKMTTVQSC